MASQVPQELFDWAHEDEEALEVLREREWDNTALPCSPTGAPQRDGAQLARTEAQQLVDDLPAPFFSQPEGSPPAEADTAWNLVGPTHMWQPQAFDSEPSVAAQPLANVEPLRRAAPSEPGQVQLDVQQLVVDLPASFFSQPDGSPPAKTEAAWNLVGPTQMWQAQASASEPPISAQLVASGSSIRSVAPFAPAQVPRRRLRRKTPPALAGVGLQAMCVPLQDRVGMLGERRRADVEWSVQFLDIEDLGPEGAKHKSAYLVTLPHPSVALSSGLANLRSPSEFDRRQILAAILDVFAHPIWSDGAAHTRTSAGVTLKRCVVFQDKHAEDALGRREIHYHIALVASSSFRFAVFKRTLRERYGLASHWSTSHDGYWSTVRYGYLPTPKKPSIELDTQPVPWQCDGPHPHLLDACQEPVTVGAIKRRRETKVKTASEAGKSEPRATELDLYSVIVEKGFRNTPDQPWACKQLIEHVRMSGGAALFQLAWRLRHRLSALIDDVWSWETVSDDLIFLGQSRLERFAICARGQCGCDGHWRRAAEWILEKNQLNAVELCQDIYRSIAHGRHESLPVVCFVGRFGGEGKSFFFAPLRNIFGEDYVQPRPQKGSFPLLDLEKKRCVILDEWDFDEHTIPLSTQLLWFEGKAFPIVRPQNKDYSGHLLYKGSAPIFITAKEKQVAPIVRVAQAAYNAGHPSQESMLLRRLKLYWLSRKLPVQPGVQMHECGACFAKLICYHAGVALR